MARVVPHNGAVCGLGIASFWQYAGGGPRILKVVGADEQSAEMKFDLTRHITEVLEGVAHANERFGGNLQVEAILVRPDDYPSPGQAKYVASKIAEHAIVANRA